MKNEIWKGAIWKNKANLPKAKLMLCHSCGSRNPEFLAVLDSASGAEWLTSRGDWMSTILQNKANLSECWIDTKSVLARFYEILNQWKHRKNKPNSKPIRLFYGRGRRARGGFRRSHWWIAENCQKKTSQRTPRSLRLTGFEKTKPICQESKWM